MSYIKACPFCGEPEDIDVITESGRYFYVMCMNCAAQSGPASTYDLAAAQWNMRGDNND